MAETGDEGLTGTLLDELEGNKLLPNIMHFGRVLRAAGLPIGAGRTLYAAGAGGDGGGARGGQAALAAGRGGAAAAPRAPRRRRRRNPTHLRCRARP